MVAAPGPAERLPHRQQSDLLKNAPSLPLLCAPNEYTRASLTVVFVLRQHAEFSGSRHTDSKLNRCTAHVTVFYVALLSFTGIDHQLIAFSAVRAVDDLSIGTETHHPSLDAIGSAHHVFSRVKNIKCQCRVWRFCRSQSCPTYPFGTPSALNFPLSPPALRRRHRDRLRNVGRGR